MFIGIFPCIKDSVYIDDGYSGTNFNRPAFQRMIEDIEAGKVNTVCTKDLSRFGREHVMMDYYLEFYFPEKKVRYIAISDNEDTEKGLSDIVPVKNIFNEWFAKDTSRKVKNALRAKHMAGERTFTYAPLGYGVNRSNKIPWAYYNCTQYRQFGPKLNRCTAHYVRYDVLYEYVLSRIRYWSRQASINEEELLHKLLKTSDKERASALKKQTVEIRKAENRKEELDRLFAKLYEDWSANRINEYNFNMLTQKYQSEQEEIDEKIKAIRLELNTEKQTAEDARKWIELIKKNTDPTELTADLLNTLIEKIVVHDAAEDEFGFRTQEIEIYYRFVGKIDE